MFLARSPSDNSRETFTSLALLGMQTGASLLMPLVVHFFERLWSGRYSKEDLRRHEQLKLLYESSMPKRRLPAFWNLSVSDGKPSLEGRARRLAEPERSNAVAPYHRQSGMIAAHVRAYIAARQERWFGHGSPGDLLDIFMNEWLEFSSELLTYSFDSASQQRLVERINYVQETLKREDIFKEGRLRRKKDKFEVMRSIRYELLECKKTADEEVSRVSAREKMELCGDSLSKLLWASAQSLYFSRTLKLHDEPFDLKGYLDLRSEPLTRNTATLYSAMKKTHTGLILKEMILRAGPNAFGECEEQKEETCEAAPESDYYDAEGLPKAVAWTRRKSDLPSWIPKAEQPAYLVQTQKLGECVLRLARIKRLFKQACYFTDKLGHAWVYGDKRGKLSIERLLFLLDEELRLFKKQYRGWYETQNSKRFHKRMERGSAEQLNYNQVDDQRITVETQIAGLERTLQELRSQLLSYSSREPDSTDAQKERFYQEVASQVARFYPKDYPRFKLLDGPLLVEDLLANFSVDKTLLDERRLLKEKPGSWLARFFPGERFSQWRSQYLREDTDFRSLLSLLQQLQEGFSQGQQKNARRTEQEIQEKLAGMSRRVASERPAWRCGCFYLRVGWPFKQGQDQKLCFLLKEFELLRERVRSIVEKMPEEKESLAEEKIASPTAWRGEKTFCPAASPQYQTNTSTFFMVGSKYQPQQPPPRGQNPFVEQKPPK